jgi:hypothetical protein
MGRRSDPDAQPMQIARFKKEYDEAVDPPL